MFDPKMVLFFELNPFEGEVSMQNSIDGDYVTREDFDQLLALYNAERQARKDDAREHQRDTRDAVAESRWADKQGEDHGSY